MATKQVSRPAFLADNQLVSLLLSTMSNVVNNRLMTRKYALLLLPSLGRQACFGEIVSPLCSLCSVFESTAYFGSHGQ